MDLWKRAAEKLGIEYELEVVDLWPKMMKAFKEKKTDVILQRMDAGQLQKENISEYVHYTHVMYKSRRCK